MKKSTILFLSALLAIVVFVFTSFTKTETNSSKYATLVVREKINDVWSCEMVTVYENGTSATELIKLKAGDTETGAKAITANLNKINAEGYSLISSSKGMNNISIVTTYVFEKK